MVSKEFRPQSALLPQPYRRSDWLNIWLIPAIVAVASALFYCTVLYPVDWDGLTYHLPPIIEAYQKGQWGNFDNPFFAVRNFPKLIESLYLWYLLHFGPHGYLFLGLLPLPIGAWACWRLCRILSISPRWSISFWCTIPIVVKQASTLYIDSFLAVFGICAALALEEGYFPLFAISIALFAGAKPSAYFPCMILIGFWIFKSIRKKRRGLFRQLWVTALLSTATCLATSLPNFLETGNPLYPFQIQAGPWTLFKGPIIPSTPSDYPIFPLKLSESNVLQRLQFTYLHSSPIAYWDMIQGAFGFPLLILGALGLIFCALRFRGRIPAPEFAIGIPFSQCFWMPRYHLWLSGGLIPWASQVLSRIPRWTRALIWVALLLQASWLWADRVWTLGQRPEIERALRGGDLPALRSLIGRRWVEIRDFGEPQSSQEKWDQFRIQNRHAKGRFYVCGEGPQMLAVLYGQDLQNQVIWVKNPAPGSGICQDGLWKAKP